MKKILFSILILVAGFALGYLVRTITAKQDKPTTPKSKISMVKKVTGIGGVFFKSRDPEKLKEWYKTRLGFKTDQYGAGFYWQESDNPAKKGFTQWSLFKESTEYFKPSEKEFMINYRVENLESLVKELKQQGVTIVDKMETFDYGKFIHIMDPEGNKIELWEPIGEL